MSQIQEIELVQPHLMRHRPSMLKGVLRFLRRKPMGAFGAFVILLMISSAIFAPIFAPYNPLEIHAKETLMPPSAKYFAGTDESGRDVLSRIIYGSRVSLFVGLIAVGIGTSGGMIVGIISAYFGGKADLIIQRFVDAMMAIPGLILAMALVSVLGPSTLNAMLAISVVIIPSNSRVVRGAVLSIKENQYIEGARAIGCSNIRVMALHILPNVAPTIMVLATVLLGGAILIESSLSFLGLGTQPPDPSWGSMLSKTGRKYMETAPWLAVAPGAAISFAVLGFNMLGDALRDVWDPRLRGS